MDDGVVHFILDPISQKVEFFQYILEDDYAESENTDSVKIGC